jgi:RNA polymerase sigma-70 factor (ECF subfamily)
MTTSNSAGPQETRIVEMVFPNQTNHYGTLFGGAALRLMDMAAFVAASRHARRPVVTASSERIDFFMCPFARGSSPKSLDVSPTLEELHSRSKWSCGLRIRGGIFRVAHNLALKQRHAIQMARNMMESDWSIAERQFDPSPSPEDEAVSTQRQHRLLAALRALPEEDQRCLGLRAEGLRYREIAEVLGMSLGAVSISLTRSLARLMRADRRRSYERWRPSRI